MASARVVYQQHWVAFLTQIYAEPGFTSELPDAAGLETGAGVLWDR